MIVTNTLRWQEAEDGKSVVAYLPAGWWFDVECAHTIGTASGESVGRRPRLRSYIRSVLTSEDFDTMGEAQAAAETRYSEHGLPTPADVAEFEQWLKG